MTMSKLTICNVKGENVGTVDVPAVIADAKHNPQVLQNALIAYRANQRGGNHSTLTKGEVAGNGMKPWRQKGTGRARAGYRQSPIWRGGGVVFGPKPRSYDKKVSRSAGKAALRLAFGRQIGAGAITVLESLDLKDAKTKAFAAVLKALKVEGGLFVVETVSRELGLAARNIPGVEICAARNLNVYQLVRHPKVFVTKAGLGVIEQRLAEESAS
jgi:large subunit ribosomal protein L4